MRRQQASPSHLVLHEPRSPLRKQRPGAGGHALEDLGRGGGLLHAAGDVLGGGAALEVMIVDLPHQLQAVPLGRSGSIAVAENG